MKWDAFIIWYYGFILTVMFLCDFVPIPKFLKRKDIVKGFPWGYYPDAVPNEESFFNPDSDSFLYNTGTKFDGVPGLGDLGMFQAFGFGEGQWQ